MSSQDATGIPFSISSDFTNFRLVELPEELVKLLSTPDPPILHLKSEASSANVVLCTESKTFPIRQVHTSNSLFIIEPRSQPVADVDGIPQDGYCAIASCGATLELSLSDASALPHLQKLLPQYSSREASIKYKAALPSTFTNIAADIPISDGEIQVAWTQLCAFEEGGMALRPTAVILLSLWKATVAAATAENIELGNSLLVEDLWATVKEEEFPRGLFDAMLTRIAEQDVMDVDSSSKWLTVDKYKCSIWVASLILETQTRADQTLPTAKFMDLWRDHLLEGWRDKADLTLLQDVCTQPSATTIILKPAYRLSIAPIALQSIIEPTSKARKWHERLKKTKG